MASSLFSEAFIIFNLNQYGQPAQIVPYWEDTATYVSVSISICRGMLRTPAVKDVFQNFMEMYHSQMSKDLVEFFISKILERFPLVFIDHSLTNPDYLAWHFRRVWNEDLKNFDTRKQALVINGLRVTAMCQAGERAESSPEPDSDAQKQFRRFLFQLAKSIFHEIGHIFVTFLGRGMTVTPPHMFAPMAGNPQGGRGEAGEYLEYLIFGGRIITLCNPDDSMDLAGISYLVNKHGTYRVEQGTIDGFIKYQFQFPIAPLGPHVTFPMITLGHHLPPVGSLEDPLNAPEIQQLLGRYKENSVKWDKAVDDLMAQNPPPEKFTEHQESVMRRVPFEPGLRLDNRPKPRAEAAK